MYRKSSLCRFDSPQCVEVDIPFHTASACTLGGCVEVGASTKAHVVLVRNSTRPDEVASFTADEWRVFVAGVKAGEFDLS
jgi:hypothetical protein